MPPLDPSCTPSGCESASRPRRAAPQPTVRFALAADPQTLNPLFAHPDAASVEQQAARLVFEPFVDLDARGRPVPALLIGSADPCRRRYLGRRADDRLPAARRVAGATACRSRPATCSSRCARFSTRQPGALARRLRSDRRARRPRRRAPSSSTSSARGRPRSLTYFSYGLSPQFVVPAHVLRAQEPLAQAPFNAAPSVGDGPYRFVSWQRGDGLRYTANPSYWRGQPAVAALDVRIVPDPGDELVAAAVRRTRLEPVAPAQLAIAAEDRPASRFATGSHRASSPDWRSTRRMPPLDDVRVRRAIALSIDRDAICAKITLGTYPVDEHAAAAVLVGLRSLRPRAGYDPRGGRCAFDRSRLAARRRRRAPQRRPAAGTALRAVSRDDDRSTRRYGRSSRAAPTRHRSDVKSISNAQLFLPATGALASGTFDLAYVPWTMGADPDDSACSPATGRQTTCAGAIRGSTARGSGVDRTVADAAQAAYARSSGSSRTTSRSSISSTPITSTRIGSRLHGFAPNAFLPTWNAYAWSLRNAP